MMSEKEREREMHGWVHYSGNKVTWCACATEIWLCVLKKRTQ